jgi:hypothetical protein
MYVCMYVCMCVCIYVNSVSSDMAGVVGVIAVYVCMYVCMCIYVHSLSKDAAGRSRW